LGGPTRVSLFLDDIIFVESLVLAIKHGRLNRQELGEFRNGAASMELDATLGSDLLGPEYGVGARLEDWALVKRGREHLYDIRLQANGSDAAYWEGPWKGIPGSKSK